VTDSSTPLVGIFGDDLTGALDAAAPFAARGFRTVVSTTHELPEGAASAEVVSINLGTRHMEPSEVSERTSGAVKALAALGVKVLLNKVDSTLRGNPGVELAAALEAISVDHAIICSAYPQNNRIVDDGVLLVDGTSVANTDVGRDQLSPISSSNVEELILLSLERAGIADQVHVRRASGGKGVTDLLPVIVAADATTDDDLLILAKRLVAVDSTALVAGSAGVASALAQTLGEGRKADSSPFGSLLTSQKILIVTASQRLIVDMQIQTMGDEIDLVLAEITADEVIEGVSEESVGRMTELVKREGVVVLKLGRLDPNEEKSTEELRTLAGTIAGKLGQFVKTITDISKPDVLVVIGGDTTSGVLNACGVESLGLQGELQPGTVSGIPIEGSIAGTLLITRAGGFGDEKSLLQLISLLKFGRSV